MRNLIFVLIFIIIINSGRFLVDDACTLPERGGCDQICTSVNNTVQCLCFPGFEMQNFSCQDVDECLQFINNNCSYSCQNLPGSYRCACDSGYRLEDDTGDCHDINECLLNNGHGPCQDTCTNTVGSYACSCERLSNTYLADDGHLCVPDDACHATACSHQCISARGSAFCLCPVGMELGGDWRTCEDINECDLENVCPNQCVNTVSSYYCQELEVTTTESEGFITKFKETTTEDKTTIIVCEETTTKIKETTTVGEETTTTSKETTTEGKEIISTSKEEITDLIETTTEFRQTTTDLIETTTEDLQETTTEDLQETTTEELQTTTETPQCAPLITPANGRFLPIQCTTNVSIVGRKCRLSCRRGFVLALWLSTRFFNCESTASWYPHLTRDQLYEICVKKSPKTFIKCPKSTRTKGKFYFPLSAGEKVAQVQVPHPESNLDWKYLIATPDWGKQSLAILPIGQYNITFRASNPVDNTSVSCTVILQVEDLEPPRVIWCPNDLRLRLPSGRFGQFVYWREPQFRDNVAVTNILQTKYSGDFFRSGLHKIEYVAEDASKNIARCKFSIYLEEAIKIMEYRRMVFVCPDGVHTWSEVQRHFELQLKTGCRWRRA